MQHTTRNRRPLSGTHHAHQPVDLRALMSSTHPCRSERARRSQLSVSDLCMLCSYTPARYTPPIANKALCSPRLTHLGVVHADLGGAVAGRAVEVQVAVHRLAEYVSAPQWLRVYTAH